MKNSAIILSGGSSKRFGRDKGLVKLTGKPMVLHVYDKVTPLVDEVLVVVSSEAQLKEYESLKRNLKLVIDEINTQSPLIGALTGFKNASGDYAVLLSCDMPLISEGVISLLLELAPGNDAVIPRWPNRYIEPLHAVYRTKAASDMAAETIKTGRLKLFDMIIGLRKVLYVSMLVLRDLDPNLNTLFNVNTRSDLAKAEKVLKSMKIKKSERKI